MDNEQELKLALRNIGIEPTYPNSQWKSTEGVFDDLKLKWQGLDKDTQKNISVLIGGVRNANKFIAWMNCLSQK